MCILDVAFAKKTFTSLGCQRYSCIISTFEDTNYMKVKHALNAIASKLDNAYVTLVRTDIVVPGSVPFFLHSKFLGET